MKTNYNNGEKMKKIAIKNFPHILHGGDYNPDQWQSYPEILAEDMRLMQLANCNEMTLGIFAWSELEPREGEFNFSFLDKAMDDIYNAGGRVILATPSASKPAWMAKKYPEINRVNPNGIRNEYGGRHNHCNNSPIYREKVRIINEKLAERYKDHPTLIAWHLSNEYGGYYNFSGCFCENCVNEFRNWLKNKYGTIEKLNHEWWNTFWSHKYYSFDEIVPPSHRSDLTTHGRNLDWKRFISDKYIEFMNVEAEPLRKITPDIPITANLMENFTEIDYSKLAKHIDFVSWDNYPRWTSSKKDVNVAQKSAFTHDLMRSFKHQPFLLMESTPSVTNWQTYNKLKRPGLHILSSLQAVAHGSDSVLYFQWRKSRGSSEKLHGAVVDHCGHENTRVFNEVKALGARLKNMDDIVGTVTESKVAVFYSMENRWALEDSQGYSNADKKYVDTVLKWHKPLWKRGINTDVISESDDFSKYNLLILPMLYMIDTTLEQKLCTFVENGGTIIATYMLGTVNENDLCHLGGIPCGKLKDVFGIWNEEIDTLFPEESNKVQLNTDKEFKSIDYCELIHLNTAKALAKYTTNFYKGYPAVTVNNYGKGKAYYVAFRDEGDFADHIVEDIVKECNIASTFDGELPNGVTAQSRTDGENEFVFIQNYTDSEFTLKTNYEWVNFETNQQIQNEITLNPISVIILKRYLNK